MVHRRPHQQVELLLLVVTLTVRLHGALETLVVVLVLCVLVNEERLQFLLVESPEKTLLLNYWLLLSLHCFGYWLKILIFLLLGGAAHEIFDEERHECTENDCCDTDHDKGSTLDYRGLMEGMFIVLISLYCENEREGNRPSDRSRNRHDRQFFVGDRPLLGEQFEDD